MSSLNDFIKDAKVKTLIVFNKKGQQLLNLNLHTALILAVLAPNLALMLLFAALLEWVKVETQPGLNAVNKS